MDGQNDFRLGHRERMRDAYLSGGFDDWEDYRILELFLFYAIPQRDVRPLAHLLIETFGSLGNVLSAGEETLCRVPGVGAHTAKLLAALPAFATASDEEDVHLPTYDRAQSIGEFLVDLYRDHPGTRAVFLLFNNRMELLRTVPLAADGITSAAVTPRKLFEAACDARAPIGVFAYCTGRDILVPTGEEIAAVTQLRFALETLGLDLLECVMLHGERFAFLIRQVLGQTGAAQKKRRLTYDDER